MDLRIKKSGATWRVYFNEFFIACATRQEAADLYERALLSSWSDLGKAALPVREPSSLIDRQAKTS
ncbi:hypothetical protein [Pseudomonas sp. RIT-PI-AD]|uniref:hypothetical protein n=1 Tax=Pseudomonas sp. RIT-PI-AD TaxID=3035294 RepID=UPI0021D8AF00|nr:hypothetical protein [Pseudomonas sp. RIT-PI-AD]